MMPKLRALKEVRYAGVRHFPGTNSAEFDASDRDAKLLTAIGKADFVKPVESDQARSSVLFTEQMQGDQTAPTGDAGTAARRRYRRRDLQSED